MKMKFKTEIQIPSFDFRIGHHDKIMMIGSCFAENISKRMLSAGFCVNTNPFGIMYNPGSIFKNIQTIISRKKYSTSDIFEYQGLYHSFDHHGKYSDISPENCIHTINKEVESAHTFLKQTSILVITFGTAFVYSLKSNNIIVSNCHKLPEKTFERKRLTVDEIVEDWSNLLKLLYDYNPGLKILFTVSPIRHWKDGAHENQLSKSTLLLAIDELIRNHKQCCYFPAYEFMMDDLRDYRFYADDMLHPSNLAIEYIWEKFSDTFFEKKTITLIDEWTKIKQALEHKPFNPDSEQYRAFLLAAQKKLEEFVAKNKLMNND